MTVRGIRLVTAVAVVITWMSQAEVAWGQTVETGPSGLDLFNSYCATCHGTSAKGDGPMASSLKVRPADLTMIAARNGGVFNADQVAQIIDGRNPVKGHGGGQMPVWGDIFSKSIDPTPVAEKIKRLVSQLQTIQQKP